VTRRRERRVPSIFFELKYRMGKEEKKKKRTAQPFFITLCNRNAVSREKGGRTFISFFSIRKRTGKNKEESASVCADAGTRLEKRKRERRCVHPFHLEARQGEKDRKKKEGEEPSAFHHLLRPSGGKAEKKKKKLSPTNAEKTTRKKKKKALSHEISTTRRKGEGRGNLKNKKRRARKTLTFHCLPRDLSVAQKGGKRKGWEREACLQLSSESGKKGRERKKRRKKRKGELEFGPGDYRG